MPRVVGEREHDCSGNLRVSFRGNLVSKVRQTRDKDDKVGQNEILQDSASHPKENGR